MDDIETATTQEIFVGLTEDQPIRARFRVRAVNPRGQVRIISRSVPVFDSELLSRLRREVQAGDTLEITTRTNWSSEDIVEELVDLRVVSRETASVATTAS